MHISEGVLAAPVLIGGAVLAAAGTAVGLRRLDYDRIAPVGLLSAAFFVASPVHIPLGPDSVHLIFNGAVGLLLGWAAFPAILVAPLLQAVFFQFGGLTTLGVNTPIMALPAVIGYQLGAPFLWRRPAVAAAAAFGCGFGGVLLAAVVAAAALMASGEGFRGVAAVLLAAHLPGMAVEGFVTAFCVLFLKRVQPAMPASGPWRRTRSAPRKMKKARSGRRRPKTPPPMT